MGSRWPFAAALNGSVRCPFSPVAAQGTTVAIHIFDDRQRQYDKAAMRISAFVTNAFVSCFVFTSIVLLTTHADAQRKPPRSEDYPVPESELYKGKPAPVLLDSKRARLYRTVLREGAKAGPNFSGHYTIVTWGAGLGVFSMAVVDAKTGKVYFPPFKEVGNTSYGLPLIDKGNNPAWRIDSRLFAFVGIPDANNKGMGMYVFSFKQSRFRLVYFAREDEKKNKARAKAWEKEVDDKLAAMAKTYASLRKRLAEDYPQVQCFKGHETKYGTTELEVVCTKDNLIVSIHMDYLSTPDEAKERMKRDLNYSGYPRWRTVAGLGDQGIETDQCSRAWLRFRKRAFYVWMNANLNNEGKENPNCSGERNMAGERLSEFARQIALVAVDLLDGGVPF